MKRRIDCLERLFALLKCKVDLLQFLKEEEVISDDTMQRLLIEHHTAHCTKIAGILADAVKENKIQLADYEWSILPVEIVKLTIVTNRTKREFEYSSL